MNYLLPALKIEQLSVSYEKATVLWDICLEVPQGKMTAIVGPNGAGKSTLLKSALGLISPVAGSVLFFGQPFKKMRGKVAYVPQRESVDWDFPITVFELVLMGMYGRTTRFGASSATARKEAMSFLEMVGLESFADRQISQLSGGQQQRAFLARAMSQQALLYLMDEPFAGIDNASSKVIVSLMHKMRDQGKTLIVVHHDLESIPSLFDWVILLNMRLVGCGPVGELFTKEIIQKTFGKEAHLFDEASRLSREKIGGLV